MKLQFFDTTLRDGAQAMGISFSSSDKQNIMALLDDFGIDFIEGGEPSFNPKDAEFFDAHKNPKLVAFGSTRHRNLEIMQDESILKLIEAGTETVCIFGKSSVYHVNTVLGVNNEDNLNMIGESVAFLKSAGKRVIFDAEHFFDGYKEDPAYAQATLFAALLAGADCVTLCDTNGGSSPSEIYEITKKIVQNFSGSTIGIHTHNDCGMAVASSIMAVKAGATLIQGTFLGFGERCGNANLSTIIANLAFKENYQLDVKLEKMTSVANAIAEISNINLDPSMPYVGAAAFAHKAGMHSDAVIKNPQSFEHIDPQLVNNCRSMPLSEMSGRSAVAKKLETIYPALDKCHPKTKEILDEIKLLESNGYQFEGADGSFMLLAKKLMDEFSPSFELISYTIHAEKPSGEIAAEVKIKVGETTTTVTESGNGPVNALDKALRKALCKNYPTIEEVSLVDYKVRVLDNNSTGAVVRVLITSRDRSSSWTTVGVSADIIEASWCALVDSLEYKLQKFRIN